MVSLQMIIKISVKQLVLESTLGNPIHKFKEQPL